MLCALGLSSEVRTGVSHVTCSMSSKSQRGLALLTYAELPSCDMNYVFYHVVLKIHGLSFYSSIRYVIL